MEREEVSPVLSGGRGVLFWCEFWDERIRFRNENTHMDNTMDERGFLMHFRFTTSSLPGDAPGSPGVGRSGPPSGTDSRGGARGVN